MTGNSFYTELIDGLCLRLQEEESPELRIRIINILQKIANEKTVIFLLKATKDENHNVREAALEAIENVEINKVHFLLYIQQFFDSQTTIQDIIQRKDIFDHIINKNLVAAQKAVKDRLPALLKNQQAIELAVSNNPKLTDRFKSAIKAVGIEKVRSIFTLADIPIEGFNQWDKNDNSKN